MTSFIKVPFASSGDKAAVPDTDAGGGVNMTQGYGQAYSLDPATDPSAKRIERDKMNWLFNRITQAINEIQSGGVAPFITSADNGGSAFSYGKGALVSLSGVVYQSLVASNTSTPPGANWSALPEKIQPLDTTLTALAGLVGVANKLPYFNGDDTAALADLTQVGRDIIGKTDIAAVLQYLGLKTAAQRDVGTGTNQIPDMNAFSSGSGWQKLPGGRILQWRGIANGSGDITSPLPIPFPNRAIGWAITSDYVPGSGGVGTIAGTCTATNIISRNTNVSTGGSAIVVGE
ncbi:hypothetical protein [Escherichia sp. 4726-5]|uniref:gp53-like domain-containing protein n=1 Tax=Escherichia sp. 4726-5 TaxID=2137852 RepID=UPI000D15106B|nr:hypothetical protein [Escherichia sp. 4726-5]PSZ18179.1 hypothetical protein C7B04_08085 [Escherichia sp. 4726-5]